VEFFKGFWPNLFATLGGALIGVPAGLWVNRLALRHAGRAEREAKDERLSHALDVLAPAMQANLDLIKQAQDALSKDEAFVIGLPVYVVSAWDVAKADVIPLLRNIQLKLGLGHHFEQLTLFVAHLERHAGYFIGTPAELRVAVEVRGHLRNQLRPFADRLADEVEKLLKDIAATRTTLAVATPNPAT